MPLFTWLGAVQVGWQLGQTIEGEIDRFTEEVEGEASGVRLTPDEATLAGLLAHRAERRDTEEAKLERSRWLEANRAERSFPCGVVPDPVL